MSPRRLSRTSISGGYISGSRIAMHTLTYHSPGLKKMSMLFELDDAYGIQFNTVRVHRTVLYPGTGNGSQLKITEVHNLNVNKHEHNCIYYAWEPEIVLEKQSPTMWYEISLTSPVAQRVLEENVNLEFGEETTWTEEDFDERVRILKSLCVPANYIVKKMDGMGFYNDNGYVAPPGVASSVVTETTFMEGPFVDPSHPDQW